MWIVHVQQLVISVRISEVGRGMIRATSEGSRSNPRFGGFRDDIRDGGDSTTRRSVTHGECASVEN